MHRVKLKRSRQTSSGLWVNVISFICFGSFRKGLLLTLKLNIRDCREDKGGGGGWGGGISNNTLNLFLLSPSFSPSLCLSPASLYYYSFGDSTDEWRDFYVSFTGKTNWYSAPLSLLPSLSLLFPSLPLSLSHFHNKK